MDEALKHPGGLLPADTESAVVLQPTNGAFHRPSPFVSAQLAPLLGFVLGLPVGAVRSDHLHALLGQGFIQSVRVIGFVSDELVFENPH